jgi:membrane protein implicated in regulation of membrane protease activity
MAMNETDIPVTDSRHPQWRQGRIGSQARRERWVYVGFALFWNAFSQPMFWLLALKETNIEPLPLLLAGLFPLAGLWLAYVAIVKTLQWWRFGNLELTMDPFPGSRGGDVGGMIELPIPYRAGKRVEVTLSCINVVINRGSKNNSRSEKVLWREHATLPVEPGMRGSRVSFSFSVPADQPATTEPSDNCIQWVVHLHRQLPGADLDQTFELPVLDTGTPLKSRHIRKASTRVETAAELPEDNVVMQHTAEGLHVFYPTSRGRSMGLALLAFGSTFGIAPWLIGAHASEFADGGGFGMLFLVFGGFFILVFGLVGLLLIGFGLYALFNSLEVNVSGAGVISTRRFLGLRFQRILQRSAIKQLRFKINAQEGQGARAKVHYLLEAVPVSGSPVCLGDTIKGQPLARRLMQELGKVLGHTEWSEARRFGARMKSR